MSVYRAERTGLVHRKIGQCGTTKQFPKPRQWGIKSRHTVNAHRFDIQTQRHGDEGQQNGQAVRFELPKKQAEKRPDQIELLLNPQTPQVQQGFGFCRIVEIPSFAPEHEIGHKPDTSDRMFAQLLVFVGQQCKPAESQRSKQDRQECWEDSFDAPRIKLQDTEAATVQVFKNDGRDQKTRDHEKNIHPNEAALHPGRKRMKSHHRQHGDGAQAVDVGAVLGVQELGHGRFKCLTLNRTAVRCFAGPGIRTSPFWPVPAPRAPAA